MTETKHPEGYRKAYRLTAKHWRIGTGTEGERVETLVNVNVTEYDTVDPIEQVLAHKLSVYALDLDSQEITVITACKGIVTIEYRSNLGHSKLEYRYGRTPD